MQVTGMCYINGRLFSIARLREVGSTKCRLAIYGFNDDTLVLLDTLQLHCSASQPVVGHFSGRVYVPCKSHGVRIALYDRSKLAEIATLSCVKNPGGVAEVSPSTLYICDLDSTTVCQVDVNQDTITAKLQQLPRRVERKWLDQIAFLGDTVLVHYSRDVVAYRQGAISAFTAIKQHVDSLTTDHHSSFLMLDSASRTVFVLDVNCTLTHTIPIPTDQPPLACTVVGNELWVIDKNGKIIIMSSA